MLWFHLAFKEITNNFRFSLFFIVNLSIGLIGFIALDSFKNSIDTHLTNNSRAILTADAQISSNSPLTEVEYGLADSIFKADYEYSDQISFLSMVAGEDSSRMSQLIGIDSNYPQYGDFILRNGGLLNDGLRQELLNNNIIWVAQDLLLSLDLAVGDSIRIGSSDLVIADVIDIDPSSTISVMSNFPPIYMGLEQINNTGLIQLGSRVSYSRFYRFDEDMDMDTWEDEFRDAELEVLGDMRRIRMTTHEEQSEDLGRILGYMNDYLGLIALIALFLAGVGAAYLFRTFFTSRFKDMAILMCLGGTPKQAYIMTLLQITLLGTISALIATLISYLALPVLPQLFTNFLPRGFVNEMEISSVALALFLGTLGSVICCLPILSKIYDLHPIALFHEKVQPSKTLPHWQRHALSYAPIMIVFWALGVWQSRSLLIGSIFIASFLAAIFVLGSLAWFILEYCDSLSASSAVTRKLALRNLSRNKLGAISCFLAIGLGSLLINLIPQIEKGLQEEISQPDDFSVPDFFMFDIQPDQLEPLRDILDGFGHELSFLSPQVRARMQDISSTDVDAFEESREEQMRERRSVNLTYQDILKNSEELVAGSMWSQPWQFNSEELPGISLEEGYAERIGASIGDTITFDVQSVPISGRVMNLRRVDWNSFQPNFFISFQPGVLDPAPKTFVAAISNVPSEQQLQIQNAIVGELQNISIINVGQIVARILDITSQISWGIKVMAYLAIFAGLVVLFSIARYEVKSRFWEINLLKILGANFSDVKSMIQIEFGILGFFAAFAGIAISLLMSYAIAWFVFDSIWQLASGSTFFSILAITVLSVLTALIATMSVLRQKPLQLLRAD
jgi:putative ABC transport system permease protein